MTKDTHNLANNPPLIDGTILRDPDRPRPKRRYRKAWRSFRNLVKNKEDTTQVFEIFLSLPSRDFDSRVRRFCHTDQGASLFRSEPGLEAILDDHETLGKLPPDSVAAAYIHFMKQEGLSTAGLNEEYRRFRRGKPDFDDLQEWYHSRQRETHDLLHVLTGYGRDALGEQCVLAFTYGQDRAPGHLLIGYAGAIEIKRCMSSNAPVLRAVREAQNLGKTCPPVVEMSIRSLLERPLAEVRRELGLSEPTYYLRCHDEWRKAGRDPHAVLAAGT